MNISWACKGSINVLELLLLLRLRGVKLELTSKWLCVTCMIPIFSGRANESWLIDCIKQPRAISSTRTNGVYLEEAVCMYITAWKHQRNLEYTFSSIVTTITSVVTFSKCSNAAVPLPDLQRPGCDRKTTPGNAVFLLAH